MIITFLASDHTKQKIKSIRWKRFNLTLQAINECICGCKTAETIVVKEQVLVRCTKCGKIRYKSWY